MSTTRPIVNKQIKENSTISALKAYIADKITKPSTNKIAIPKETLKYLLTICEMIAVPPVEALPRKTKPRPAPVIIPPNNAARKILCVKTGIPEVIPTKNG